MAIEERGGTGSSVIMAYENEFSGSGWEYFRVWIVNLLLTIVTVGFFTPFARRRTAQYFYGHTIVAGSPLEFTAQQRKMVFGFLILVGLYAAFRVASDTGQETTVGLMLLAAAALAPYFWASAMRFRMNATRWRGVRLQFTARWGEVYRAGWPVFAIALAWFAAFLVIEGLLSRGRAPSIEAVAVVLAAVFAALAVMFVCMARLEFNYKSLLVARGRVGGQPGRWKPVFGDFLRIWVATFAVLVGSLVLVVVLLAAVGLALGASMSMVDRRSLGLWAFLLGLLFGLLAIVVLFLASAPARAYHEARVFRLVWDNIGVSQIARFKCSLRVWRYVALRVRNIFLTFFTFGFFRPFALVSEYRMKTESVTLHVKGGLDQLAGQLAREEQGLGDAIADAAGLDLVG